MENLLRLQLTNFFVNSGDRILGWNELLESMSATFGRTRDEVYEGMNQLIDSGEIVVPKKDTYCTPATLARLKKEEAKRALPIGAKEMSRSDFELLSFVDRSKFIKSGGVVK
jgi:hypothetical protein